jgi:hypothetical protein
MVGARTVIVVALGLVAALVTPAAADASYHVEGQADAGASDPKVAALDVAFAAATREALSDLVTPADRRTHKAELDREIVGRARRWVASYKVTSDRTDGDVRTLELDVRMDHDKLIARLGELGIAAAQPDQIEPQIGAPGHGKTATVLLTVTTARGVVASYGASAARDVPGLASASASARAAGWQLVAAPASGPAPSKGDGMLDDDAARALAAAAGAELAVVIAVDADMPGEVRGTSDHAVLARAKVRIVDRAGGVVGDGAALGGARGTGDGVAVTAIASAAADAVAEARPAGAVPGRVTALDPAAGEVLIRVSARDRKEAPPWSMVRAIRDKLASGKGTDVAIRRLSTRQVVIAVRGGDRGADTVARDIRDLERKITDTSFATKVDGNVVDVKVSGSP